MYTTAWVIAVLGVAIAAILALRLRQQTALSQQFGNRSNEWREQAEAHGHARTTAESQLAALSGALTDPVIFIDANQTIVSCNCEAQTLLGNQAAAGISLMQATRSNEFYLCAEAILSRSDELQPELTLNNRLFRVRGAQTEGGAVLVLRDVSELQRLGRARRDFVANISHELRTPLTAIRLLVDKIQGLNANSNPGMSRALEQIGEQTDSLTQIAQELYDLAQIESGQVPMRMMSASLYEVADAALSRLTPQASRAGLRLVNNVPDDLRALIDAGQIGRVISNLVHNAIKFTSSGGVTVFVQHQPTGESNDDFFIIAVRDTGAGIDKPELSRIFERFYKVDRARGQAGTGLGLAIAKHIVEAHGGTIWAESDGPGTGTTFFFSVPCDG